MTPTVVGAGAVMQHVSATDPRDAATRARRDGYTPARRATADALSAPTRPTGPAATGISAGDVPTHVRGVVPCWLSRAHWQRMVKHLARTELVARACRSHGLSVTTWQAVLIEASAEADSSTGTLRASHASLGRIVKRSAKQVQRALTVAHEVGLAAPLYGARELGKAERLALVATTPGHTQRGIPPVWQLAWLPQQVRVRLHKPHAGRWIQPGSRNVHLPRRGNPRENTSPEHTLASAAHAAKTEPPPAAQHQRRRPRPGAALAYALCDHPQMQMLTPRTPAASLIGLLHGHALGGWTAHQLVQVLNATALAHRIDPREPARSPHGLLRMLLDRIDADAHMHLYGPGYMDASAAAVCDRTDCDGHGWLLTAPREPARKCPDCAPAARSNNPW